MPIAQLVIHRESHENVQTARDRLREQNRLPREQVSTRNIDEVADCPICIAPPEYAVETNCGHIFCGSCMMTYWQSVTEIEAICCPVCRRNVTLMLFLFSEEEVNISSTEKDDVIAKINAYNRQFPGEPTSTMDEIREQRTLLRHLFRQFSKLTIRFRLEIAVIFTLALLYLISPVDIIPEILLGPFGYVDDLVLLFNAAKHVCQKYKQLIVMGGLTP